MSNQEVAVPQKKAEIEQLVLNLESISEEIVVQFDALTDRLEHALGEEEHVPESDQEPERFTVMGRRLQSVYRRLASLLDNIQGVKVRVEL